MTDFVPMILVSGCQHLFAAVLGEGRPTVWLPARPPYLHPDTTSQDRKRR